MKIKIFQVNTNRDGEGVAFESLERTKKILGTEYLKEEVEAANFANKVYEIGEKKEEGKDKAHHAVADKQDDPYPGAYGIRDFHGWAVDLSVLSGWCDLIHVW